MSISSILVFPRISLNTASQSRQDFNFLGNPSMWRVRGENMTVKFPKTEKTGKQMHKSQRQKG